MNIYSINQKFMPAFQGRKEQRENIASITRERFEEVAKRDIPVKEKCKILNIPERTYSRLLDKYEIITPRKAEKARVNAITAEDIQIRVDRGDTPRQIANDLQISNTAVYRLLKRFKTKYTYLHHYKEIEIPTEVLELKAASGENTHQIASELGIAQTTYHNKIKTAKVKTVLRESIDTISAIPKEVIQGLIDKGLKISEICKQLNITRANYTALIRKYNSQTPQRKSMEIISKISKQQILELRAQGKLLKEICKELSISMSTLRRILNRK